MNNSSITFGFYKGLGDFISDSFLMDYFYKSNYKLKIILSNWLYDIGNFLFPKANIIKYEKNSDILDLKFNDNFIFLSPNYLHPITVEYRAVPLYIIKYLFVRKRTDRNNFIIKPMFSDLFFYYFNLKRTFLDKHFFYMSYYLLKPIFPELIDYKKLYDKNTDKKIPINRVFIFPFSGDLRKDYPVEKYINIAKNFKILGIDDITFFVLPKDINKLKHIKNEFHVKSKTLVEFSEILKETDLVICSDSGPAHLSAKFGANVLVLYGFTSPYKYKPIGKNKILTLYSKKIKNIKEKNIIDTVLQNFYL